MSPASTCPVLRSRSSGPSCSSSSISCWYPPGGGSSDDVARGRIDGIGRDPSAPVIGGIGPLERGSEEAEFATGGPPTGAAPHHDHFPSGAPHMNLVEYIKDQLPTGLSDPLASLIGMGEGTTR